MFSLEDENLNLEKSMIVFVKLSGQLPSQLSFL